MAGAAWREAGAVVRRQYVVGRYIADFAVPSVRVVIEVDGAYHASRRAADARRDRELGRRGWRVLRLPAELAARDLGKRSRACARCSAAMGDGGTPPGVTKRVDRHLSSPLRHLVSERNSGFWVHLAGTPLAEAAVAWATLHMRSHSPSARASATGRRGPCSTRRWRSTGRRSSSARRSTADCRASW
ncbi:MAG: DUF559 domain-containing protein [Polyangiaceae bacterium]|nr:DUF559 domain-containing protein [Polyangiaceae bacterium]